MICCLVLRSHIGIIIVCTQRDHISGFKEKTEIGASLSSPIQLLEVNVTFETIMTENTYIGCMVIFII